MFDLRSLTRARRAPRYGFTLIEILIVGALIALFAGLAIFGAQQFYDSQRRKAMFAETREIGAALSFVRDDVNFYPRLHLLDESVDRIQLNTPIDTYGRLVLQPGSLRTKQIAENWRGPYLTLSVSRRRLAQGQRGIVEMALPDDPASPVVDWPSDTWGSPYVVYQVSLGGEPTADNPLGLRFTERPGEQADYFNAVVSYGVNTFPGGNENTLDQGTIDELIKGALFYNPRWQAGVQPEFTLLTSAESTFQPGGLTYGLPSNEDLARTLNRPAPNSEAGDVGIRDTGSDDVIFGF